MSRIKQAVVTSLSRRAAPFLFFSAASILVVSVPHFLFLSNWNLSQLIWLVPVAISTIICTLLMHHFSIASPLAPDYSPSSATSAIINAMLLGSIAGACTHMCFWGTSSTSATTFALCACLGAASFVHYTSSLRPQISVLADSSLSFTSLLKQLPRHFRSSISQRTTALALFSLLFLPVPLSASLGLVTFLYILRCLYDISLFITLLHSLNFSKLQQLLDPSSASPKGDELLLCEVLKQAAPSHLYTSLHSLLQPSGMTTSKPAWKEALMLTQEYSDSISSNIESTYGSASAQQLRRPVALTSATATAVATPLFSLALGDLIAILRYDSLSRTQLYRHSLEIADVTLALTCYLIHTTHQLQCIVAHMESAAAPKTAVSSASTTAMSCLIAQREKLSNASALNKALLLLPPVLSSKPFSASTTTTISQAAESVSLLLLQALASDKQRSLHHLLPCSLCALLGLSLTLQQFATACNLHQHTLRKSSSSRGRFIDSNNLSLAGVSLIVEESINRLLVGYSDVIPSYSFPSEYASLLKNKMASIATQH